MPEDQPPITNRQPLARRVSPRSGVMLVELLVYIGALIIVTGVATALGYAAMENSISLGKAAGEIGRSLDAGERWRDDIRAAAARIKLTVAEQEFLLEIPHSNSVVSYRFDGGKIWRRPDGRLPWTAVLKNVKRSAMHLDEAPGVKSWRWEVELKAGFKKSSLRPLFTFLAAPPQEAMR